MVKKMIYLDDDQNRAVKLLAKRAGSSETEIIRRAIDAYGKADEELFRAQKQEVVSYISSRPEGWEDEPSDFFKG